MTMPSPFIWIYEDRGRGLALVRGHFDKVVLATAGIDAIARWSSSGKGLVFALDHVADFCAACDHHDVRYRFKQVAA